ncbi:MAG TPA: NAD-dependent epimerase/dehydratase family protein [Ktedonobacterales bacterium]|nr:NAD-dependent epimerase/dehydratase family protein [Ktedonobacterales bacterium]
MEAQHVLVTGGAGFLGVNLLRHLAGKGYALASLDLAECTAPDLIEQVTFHRGDIRDPDAVQQALQGIDLVVHTAAALPRYATADIYTTEVDGTRTLLQEAQRQQVQRFIHISSTAVYGVPDHHPLLETDALSGVGPYGKAKIQAEQVCLEFRAQGMILPILRPKTFVGPERLGVFALLYQWAVEGRNFPILGSGRNRYQLLDVEDLCIAILLCLTQPVQAVNETFNIGAKVFKTVREEYQSVLDCAGFGKKVVSIPARPAILGLQLLDRLHLSPLYPWIYETAARDSFASIERAEHALGYAPTYSNEQALLRNFEWYRSQREPSAMQAGITHRVPWKQGVLGLLKAFF